MEILRPSHPPASRNVLFSGVSPQASFRNGFNRTSRTMPELVEECGGDQVCVAVGKSVDKAAALLKWTFTRFGSEGICILHVHQPSPFIPTLLGKLPASHANSEVVSAYRREEREQTKKLLLNYLSVCSRSKVKANIITIEADTVKEGIVDLVNKHGVKTLVVGGVPMNCVKGKKSSHKASYAAKNVPLFCEIWFVNKGKLVWIRGASQNPSFEPLNSQLEPRTVQNLRSQSLPCHSSEISFQPECLHSNSDRNVLAPGIKSWVQDKAVQTGVALSSPLPTLANGCNPDYLFGLSSSASALSCSDCNSFAERRLSSDSDTKTEEESLCNQFAEIELESERSRNEALKDLLKRKTMEAEAAEAISKAKALESVHMQEVALREEAEKALKTTIQEQEKLLEERESVTLELQKAMRHIMLLDSRAHEANRRCKEAAGELKLVQASLATLWQEKRKIQKQKTEATYWLDCWRSYGKTSGNLSSYISSHGRDSTELADFSLLDLQTATCNFSESFRIGQGGHGSVYKGEILNRTVAIKSFHPYNMQGQSKFLQEVQTLSKLQHPHLVKLIGICPETWSLVHEYLPGGSLQDRLFSKCNYSTFNWKTRVRIIAEVATALLFLHSSKPEKIVHGNLKPENILLDYELCCKLCDVGISRLVSDQTLRCPSFRLYAEPKGAFPYTDPEFRRTGNLTTKSDVYSFGLIILQLLTGRTPAGLAMEVRKSLSCGKLMSMVESSAGEWPTFVVRRLVDLGLQCCELSGVDRPELTSNLLKELEQLQVLEERSVPSFFLCPIVQDIMHDPQVAADGFSYEGEAIRSWLNNGNETSPMTNLKLSHLQLTPNQSLGLAIQDWLCSSS